VWRPEGQSRYSGVDTAGRIVASFSTSTMSCPSELHDPSVPRLTLTPLAA